MSENLPGNDTEDVDSYKAVLFPFFTIIVGVSVSYLLSRRAPDVPYTAVMYIIGVVMGVVTSETSSDNVLKESINLWSNIDPELLLLTFLPALIFGDVLQVKWHEFRKSLPQTLSLAFPGVLVGTILTGSAVYYVFPLGWSWNLCLTLGAILSATDPVAVTATLEDVGAPPRLRMVVEGEAMLNDGSAIVFFTIFSELYLAEKGEEGIGESYDIPTGVGKFFQMSVGGALVGVAFSIMLNLVLWLLNRKLGTRDSVLQVASTIAFAYMSYFVAEVVAGTSGVLSVVFCGILTSAVGLTLVHDQTLLHNVWSMIEFLGNTILFTLGGVVWGESMVGASPQFATGAYAYIFVLFAFMTLIRIVVLLVFYPIVAYTGLGANVAEHVVMWWGGLRGAVGIALALSISNDASQFESEELQEEATRETAVLFGFVGAMALLTLVVNAPTMEPLLNKLGLIGSSAARVQMVQSWHEGMRRELVDKLASLLEQPKFALCSLDLVRLHVPALAELTDDEIDRAREVCRSENAEKVALETEAGVSDADLLLAFQSSESASSGQDFLPLPEPQDEPVSPLMKRRSWRDIRASPRPQDGSPSHVVSAGAVLDGTRFHGRRESPNPIARGGGANEDDFDLEMAPSREESQGYSPDAAAGGGGAAGAGQEGDEGRLEDGQARLSQPKRHSDSDLRKLSNRPRMVATPTRGSSRALSVEEGTRMASMRYAEDQEANDRMRRANHVSVRLRRQGAGNVELPQYAQRDLHKLVRRAELEEGRAKGDEEREFKQRAKELREVFVNMQRYCYWKQIENGELSGHTFVDYTLLQSLEVSSANIAQGGELADWAILQDVGDTRQSRFEAMIGTFLYYGCSASYELARQHENQLRVIIASAFVDAHRKAQRELSLQFSSSDPRLDRELHLVLLESQREVSKAREYINSAPDDLVVIWVSHLVAVLILNVQTRLIRRGQSHGYLLDREVQSLYDTVNSALSRVRYCTGHRWDEGDPEEVAESRRESSQSSSAASQSSKWSMR
ncbi:Sodium/hydrogen exchanger 7 [Hondaea fermentalgiana]|uniref:Sodium/hydrogen exchanger 7 n=1 Tax=Hondaea fermentalgiana TaxID=2315210 RepID=A0A2R5GNS3_9STRA|nr:Sodium/hydrogen exchanger 7 [Hondaea fermentalgiana]|eukprot:GBG32542.1 Sodium/hydrogen exchanger 7 [Hondaea fermentalgiana]